ncbi:MAG TPA: hypothetical protein VGM88_20960 [Kofleriaceae bacterium]
MTALHALLVAAVVELAVNRVAVPMLRPVNAQPPVWHEYLDYLGLFAFYFTGALSVFVIASRAVEGVLARRGLRANIAYTACAVAGLLCAVPLVVAPPAALTFAIELVFAVAAIALVVAGIGRGRDLGVQIGVAILVLPLLCHTLTVVGALWLWPENTFDGPGVTVERASLAALCVAAVASPYCFAPRPFARSVTRFTAILIALLVALTGALVARDHYPALARAANLAIGVDLSTLRPEPQFAVDLLAVATLAWTLASCLLVTTSTRHQVAIGLALVVAGGFAFHWPHHYLLPLIGLTVIVDAGRTVREDELADEPIASRTPPVTDGAWSTYIGQVVAGLRRSCGDVHSLTTRGEGGLASSLIIGEAHGLPVRARIDRIDGSVLGIDVVIGREIDEVRGATLALWAHPPRGTGPNPPAPTAAPAFKTGDAVFDEHFKSRGSAVACGTLLDPELRARAAAALDGWLAYWERDSLRYRVYPGRGAPLDHPMPLSDLSLGRPATAERFVAVIELLAEIAARGVVPPPVSAPPEELT